jgi:hypothetical protein
LRFTACFLLAQVSTGVRTNFNFSQTLTGYSMTAYAFNYDG